MEIQPLVGNVSSGFGAGAPTPPQGKGDELKEASYDFMALLYSYTFSQMRAGSEENEEGLFGGSNSQMFMGFFDQEMGEKFARAEGSELSNTLFMQLSRKVQ